MSHQGARDAAYETVIGGEFARFAAEEAVPAIEVRRYRGKPVRGGPECDVWLTSGMSDVAMKDERGETLRRELIFYAPPGGDYAGALRAVASYPFEDQTFLDHGHSIQTYGTLFAPRGFEALLSEDAPAVELPHLVLLTPLLRHHRRLSEELVLEGDAVQLLWPVPISVAEHGLKRRAGTNALLDLFDREKHPWLFDPERKSYAVD
jgi:hypothetical protein